MTKSDQATHGSGNRNAEHDVGSDKQGLNRNEPAPRHIDPAEEAMQQNPNLSPPIHFPHD